MGVAGEPVVQHELLAVEAQVDDVDGQGPSGRRHLLTRGVDHRPGHLPVQLVVELAGVAPLASSTGSGC